MVAVIPLHAHIQATTQTCIRCRAVDLAGQRPQFAESHALDEI